jgi:hypothetical protein
MNGSILGRGRVLAPLAVGVALLAAGCGGGGGSHSASGSSGYQKDVAFAHCMRSHGVPDWPDPLPGGGFPRTGAGGNSPLADSAINACQHLLPPIHPPSAAQEAHLMAQGLRYARCMRSHGFSDFPDPSASGGGLVFPATPGFDPNSPQAQAADKACQIDHPKGPPMADRSSSIGTRSLLLQEGRS